MGIIKSLTRKKPKPIPTSASNFSAQEFIQAALNSGEISRRLFISYGAMNHIFKFMQEREILCMQALNRFMYHRGVERLQNKVKAKLYTLYFTYQCPGGRSWKRSLFGYDCFLRKPVAPVNLPFHPGITKQSKMVHYGNTVLFFGFYEVKVTKLHMPSIGKHDFTDLSCLERKATFYSLAKYLKSRVYLIGGSGTSENGLMVDYFDLKETKW